MEGADSIINSIDKTSKKLSIGDTAFAGVGLVLNPEEVMILDDLLESIKAQVNSLTKPCHDLTFEQE